MNSTTKNLKDTLDSTANAAHDAVSATATHSKNAVDAVDTFGANASAKVTKTLEAARVRRHRRRRRAPEGIGNDKRLADRTLTPIGIFIRIINFLRW